ncbi:MAG: hypothetical protein JST87_10335 [Bacteroidetes bacterium]|nr:hypothetical protein [Bacteroidota bacterium]
MENLPTKEKQKRFFTDNTQFIFRNEYCEGKIIYQVSFHPDISGNEEYERADRYKIVLEHYTGTHTFYMLKQNHRWVVSCENISYLIAKVGMTRIDWIEECISRQLE